MVRSHDAGWSSPVARRAHNPKVGGSNPPPATNKIKGLQAKVCNPFLVYYPIATLKTKKPLRVERLNISIGYMDSSGLVHNC